MNVEHLFLFAYLGPSIMPLLLKSEGMEGSNEGLWICHIAPHWIREEGSCMDKIFVLPLQSFLKKQAAR